MAPFGPPSGEDSSSSHHENNKMGENPTTTTARDRRRSQSVFIRRDDEVGAMAWDDRFKSRVKNLLGRASTGNTGTGADAPRPPGDEEEGIPRRGDGAASNKPVQYRLEATHRTPQQSSFKSCITCCGLFGGNRNGGVPVGMNPNQQLAMYLHWMFRVNFVFLFAVMCITFFALVIIFAGFIAAAGIADPQCVRVGSEVFDASNTPFSDAFALSWTTFSTVGYGSTYPGLGYQNSNWANCFFVNFCCSLESLLGILYSGFCGAVLFGKVLRIQSHAQVIFSDPIVVRYGPGVVNDNDGMSTDDSEEDKKKIPCPVLEFRIVNRLFNEVGGEIMDATLNVVANVDTNDVGPSGGNGMNSTDHSHEAGPYRGADSVNTFDSEGDTGSHAESSLRAPSELGSNHPTHRRMWSNSITGGTMQQTVLKALQRKHPPVDDDPTTRLVSKHIFSKMTIEASDHPFFKRVWLARHVLDENSPILKPKVRRLIRRNNGSWPRSLNNYQGVRDALTFNQILVSLNGVSNVSASVVYAQKIYDFVDVNIGYQFVNILYRDPASEGSLGVDTDLINDVCEQNGGGGEPLLLDE